MANTMAHAEFSDYPLSDLPAMPEGFVDSSWHNDTCPSYMHEDLRLQVFIDYADPAKRELPHSRRFTLLRDRDDDEGMADTLISTDDWNQVLATIETQKVRA